MQTYPADLKSIATEIYQSENEIIDSANKLFYPQGFKAVRFTGKKLNTLTLKCHRSGKPRVNDLFTRVRSKLSKKCDCPFKITFSCTCKGWSFNSDQSVNVHNHVLLQPWNRFTPEIIEFIRKQEIKTVNWKVIQDLINHKFNCSFSYDEVYYRLYKLRHQSEDFNEEEDVQGLLQQMMDQNLIDFRTDRIDSSYYLIVTTKAMIIQYKLWAKDILVVDTTFGTNRAGLKLWAAAWISNNGKTNLVAFGLMEKENYVGFRWIFSQFFDMTGMMPRIVMTDSDPAMREVFKKEFPNIIHYLCGWHVQLNIKKHIASLLKTNKDGENKKFDYLQIVNLPFEKSKKIFDQISEKIETDGFNLSDKVSDYLKILIKHKSQWSIWYRTNNEMDLQISTSSRIEGLFSLLKRYIRSKSTLYELFKKILIKSSNESYLAAQEARCDPELQENNSLSFKMFEFYKPIIDIKLKFSSYVLNKCLEALSLSLKLKWIETENSTWQIWSISDSKSDTETVTMNTEIYRWTCNYFIGWGLPWNHIFAVCFGQLKDDDSNKLYFNKRWEKDSNENSLLIMKISKSILDFFNTSNYIKIEDKTNLEGNPMIIKYEYLVEQEQSSTLIKKEPESTTKVKVNSRKRTKSFVEKYHSKRQKFA